MERHKHFIVTHRMANLALISLLLVISTGSGTAHAREVSSPTYGGGGGRPYNLDCGPGAVLVGARGKVGEWVDRLQGVCRRVHKNGALGETYFTRETGGNGGSVRNVPCPSGYVVGGIRVDTTGSYVRSVYLGCYRWNSRTGRYVSKEVPDHISFVFSKGYSTALFSDYTNHASLCPDGKPGHAISGKSGEYIDSIRLVCDKVNVKLIHGKNPTAKRGAAKAKARRKAKDQARERAKERAKEILKQQLREGG